MVLLNMLMVSLMDQKTLYRKFDLLYLYDECKATVLCIWLAKRCSHVHSIPSVTSMRNHLIPMFRVCYQNVHGVPRDDVTLAQDLQALDAFEVAKVGCLCFSEMKLGWNRPHVKYCMTSCHGNARHGHMQLHRSRPPTWNQRRTT